MEHANAKVLDENAKTYKTAEENWRAYLRGRNAGHDEYVEFAKKCDRFYVGGGGQWEDTLRRQLEAEGRPALETNLVLSTVNGMLGTQTASRADVVFKPRKNAVAETADALSQLVDQILENNMFSHKETQVFGDGLIQERGYFDVRMDWSDHLRGEVRITDIDPTTVVLDPDAKGYHPDEWKEVTVAKWVSLDDIELLYGEDKRKEVEAYASSGFETFGYDSVRWEENTFGDAPWFTAFEDVDNKRIRSLRLIERQHRRVTMAEFFVDDETGDMRMISSSIPKERRAAMAAELGMSIVRKPTSRIRWTASVDHITMHDEWSPYKNFTVVPYFPYFRRGKPFGVVRNLISPQEKLNKTDSQELHVINTTANSGYKVKSGSLVNMTVEELAERGAETGLVLEYNGTKDDIDKIQPNQIPTGLAHAADKAKASIREISGTAGLMSPDTMEVSGVTLRENKSIGMVHMQVPFDNLAYTRKILAKNILDLVQQYYDDTRVLQVVDYGDPERGVRELVVNEPREDGSIFNDLTIGEYSVTVSSAPARDSVMDTTFAEALQLREVGVEIPDDVIIESSNLPNKMKIAERVRDRQGLGDPTQEELQMLQWQQEMMMQQTELELREMQAKVEKLMSEAAENYATAQAKQAESDPQRFAMEMQMKQAALMADFQKARDNLQNKLELARFHTRARAAETAYTTTAKTVTADKDRSANLAAAFARQGNARPQK